VIFKTFWRTTSEEVLYGEFPRTPFGRSSRQWSSTHSAE
jgi:hypothetical protein